jgi:RNA polymerase primary sigma factor
MAKQRQLRRSADADMDLDMEMTMPEAYDSDAEADEEMELNLDLRDNMGGELDDDLDVDTDDAQESAPREMLSPEAALEYLLNLGRSQGYVSYDDVLQVMPEAESNMDQLEDTFASLFEQGIEVGQARDEDDASGDDPTDAEVEMVEEPD